MRNCPPSRFALFKARKEAVLRTASGLAKGLAMARQKRW